MGIMPKLWALHSASRLVLGEFRPCAVMSWICAAEEAAGGDLHHIYLLLSSMELTVEDFLGSSGSLGTALPSPAALKPSLFFLLPSPMKFYPGVGYKLQSLVLKDKHRPTWSWWFVRDQKPTVLFPHFQGFLQVLWAEKRVDVRNLRRGDNRGDKVAAAPIPACLCAPQWWSALGMTSSHPLSTSAQLL